MIRFLLLSFLVLAPSGLQVEVSGTPRKRDKAFELALEGKTKGFPDQSIVTMRFFRMVNKISWKDRSIVTVPVETPWHRKVYVDKNAFAHVERFEAPGEVAVEFCFFPDDQEGPDIRKKMGLDYRPWSTAKRFRVARPADAAAALKRDAKEFGDFLGQARGLLKACAVLMDDPEALKKEGPARKKEIDKLLGRLREEERRSALTASLGAFLTILSDVYNTFGTTLPKDGMTAVGPQNGGDGHEGGTGGPTSALTGEGLSLEKAREIVEGLRLVSERESALDLLLEAAAFLSDLGEARREDAPKWARAKVLLEKDLNSIRNLWTEWTRASETLEKIAAAEDVSVTAFLRQLDDHFQSAVKSPDGPKLDDEAKALVESAARLEKRLRGGN